MPNVFTKTYRDLYPNDPRTDDEITLAIGQEYGPDKLSGFPDFASDYQRLTDPKHSIDLGSSSPGISDYVKQATGAFGRSIGSGLSSFLEPVGIIARNIGRESVSLPNEAPIVPPPAPGAIEEAPRNIATALTPAPVPGLENSLLATQLPGALGSGVSFLAGGAALAPIRALGATARIAGLGALSGFQQGYADAESKGASEDQRLMSAFLNAGVNTSEAIPLANMLKRLDGLSGHTLKQALIHGAQESFEEAIQNSFQGVAGDVIASRVLQYDKDREAFSSLKEDAVVGGLSGAILSLATSAIGAKINSLKGRLGLDPNAPVPPVAKTEADAKKAAAEPPVDPITAMIAQQYGMGTPPATGGNAEPPAAPQIVPPVAPVTLPPTVAPEPVPQAANAQAITAIGQDFVERIGQLGTATEAQRTRSQLARTLIERKPPGYLESLAGLLNLAYDPSATAWPSIYSFVQPEQFVPWRPTPTTEVPNATDQIQQQAGVLEQRGGTPPLVPQEGQNRELGAVDQGEGAQPGTGNSVPSPAVEPVIRPDIEAITAPSPRSIAAALAVRPDVTQTAPVSPKGFIEPTGEGNATHEIVDQLDWKNSPLQPTVSAQGVQARGELSGIPEDQAILTRGEHKGENATVVHRGSEESTVRLESTGEEVVVPNRDFKLLTTVRDEIRKEAGGKETKLDTPAFYTVTEQPKTEADLEMLLSRHSPDPLKVIGKGGKTTMWTHRLTALLKNGKVFLLPTYKTDSGYVRVGMPDGGTQLVTDMIKRGYKVIGSLRTADPTNAKESAKLVLPYADYLARIEEPAKATLSGLRSRAEGSISTGGIEETGPGQVAPVATVAAVLPTDFTLSTGLAEKVHAEMVMYLVKKPNDSPHDAAENSLVALGKNDSDARNELKETVVGLHESGMSTIEALDYVTTRIAETYSNTGSGQDFTRSLGQTVPAVNVAKGVSSGLSQVASRGLGGGTSAGGGVSAAPAANSPISPRLRVGSGERSGEAGDLVASKYLAALDSAAIQGLTVHVLQDKLDAINAFYKSNGSGISTGDSIAIVNADLIHPDNVNLIALLHEIAEHVLVGESPEMRARFLESIPKLTDVQLRTNLSQDEMIRNRNLPADKLGEELLVESVAMQFAKSGWTRPESNTILRRIIRLLSDIYNRVSLAIQSTLFGDENINPQRAREYFRTRVESFLAGDPQPMSFTTMLGGGKPTTYQTATYYYPVNGTYAPVSLNFDGTLTYQDFVPSRLAAVLNNIDNAVGEAQAGRIGTSESMARLTSPTTVDKLQPIAPDAHSTERAHADYAARVAADETLRKAYNGLVSVAPQGSVPAYEALFGTIAAASDSDLTDPAKDLDLINRRLQAQGQAPVAPGTTIDTMVNPSAANQAVAKQLSIVQKYSTGLSKLFQRATDTIDRTDRTLPKQIDRENRLALRDDFLRTFYDETKQWIKDTLADYKLALRSKIKGVEQYGRLTQQIKALEGSEDAPRQYEKLIDKMSDRILKNEMKFTDFMARANELFVDWQAPIQEIKARIMSNLANDPFLQNLSDYEASAAVALVASFAKDNDAAMAWLKVRQSNDHEAAKQIREMIKAAAGEAGSDLTQLMSTANRLPRLKVPGVRIATSYRKARIRTQTMLKERADAERMMAAQAAMAPILQQEMNRMETALGATHPVTIQHGENFPLPRSVEDTDEELRDQEHQVEFDHYASGEQIKSWYDRIDAWLDANIDRGGAVWNQLQDVSRQLHTWNASNYLDGPKGFRQGALAKIIAPASDLVQNTGSPAAYDGAVRMRNYRSFHDSRMRVHHEKGVAVAAAQSRAMKALKVRNGDVFDRVFRGQAYDYINQRSDLMVGRSESEAEDAAFQAWRNQISKDPIWKDRITTKSWPLLLKFYKAEGAQHRAFQETQKDFGKKITDPFLQLERDTLGQFPFVVSRGMNQSFNGLWDKMRPEWNGTKNDRLTSKNIEEGYNTLGKDDLEKSLAPLFPKDVWNDFVGEMANRRGISMFSGPRQLDGTWLLAKPENVREAYASSTGPVDFAVQLYKLEGGSPGFTPAWDLPAFVGETIETFQNYFDAVEDQVSPGVGTKLLWGVDVGIPRFMSDARISNSFPPGWLSYRGMDQNSARVTLMHMAFEAAFGTNGDKLAIDLNNAEKELGVAKDRWEKTRAEVEIKNPDATGKKLIDLTKKQLKEEGAPVGFISNATDNLKILQTSRDFLKSWFKSTNGDLVEAKAFLEALSTVTGLMVQGPKTGLINSIDLWVTPLLQLGVSKTAVRQIKTQFASFLNSTAGGLLQTVNVQLKTNSENQLRRNRLGLHDSDAFLKLYDQLEANMSASVGISDRPLSEAVVKGARAIRIVTQTGFPDFTGKRVYQSPKLAFFNYISKNSNDGMVDGSWNTAEGYLRQALQFLRDNPDRINDPALQITADDIKLKNGWFWQEKDAFDNWKAALRRYGIILESAARDALKPGAPLFSDWAYRQIATMAISELSQESGLDVSPRWLQTGPARVAAKLLAWSLAQSNKLRTNFLGNDGEINRRTVLMGLYALAATMPAAIAYAFLSEKYDEKLLGKKSNIRGPSEYTGDPAHDLAAFIEQTARLGSFGLWGDMANTAVNFATGGDLRGISLDNRIVFANSILGMINAMSTWAHQGTADYQSVYRQMLQSLGGSGYLQYGQIINNMLSLDNAEARVTNRINIGNWLRSQGRVLGMDVRIQRGGAPDTLPNPITPAIANMVLAAYSNNVGDFMESYRDAIDASRDKYGEEAAAHVRQAYSAHNPLRTTFSTPPSETDYQRILSSLPDTGRQAVSTGVNLFNRYGEMIGANPYLGKTERQSTVPRGTTPFQAPSGTRGRAFAASFSTGF